MSILLIPFKWWSYISKPTQFIYHKTTDRKILTPGLIRQYLQIFNMIHIYKTVAQSVMGCVRRHRRSYRLPFVQRRRKPRAPKKTHSRTQPRPRDERTDAARWNVDLRGLSKSKGRRSINNKVACLACYPPSATGYTVWCDWGMLLLPGVNYFGHYYPFIIASRVVFLLLGSSWQRGSPFGFGANGALLILLADRKGLFAFHL